MKPAKPATELRKSSAQKSYHDSGRILDFELLAAKIMLFGEADFIIGDRSRPRYDESTYSAGDWYNDYEKLQRLLGIDPLLSNAEGRQIWLAAQRLGETDD